HDNGITASHLLFGGKQAVVDKAAGLFTVLLIARGSAEPLVESVAPKVLDGVYVAPAAVAQVIERRNKPVKSANVSTARVVVCVGRGVDGREQLDHCCALAQAMGGVVGCSRPVTEGSGALMPGEEYIGSTGIAIKPDVYIGVGVSGQTQHTMGMIDSKRVVVINKNSDAPFFRKCDYGIVGNMDDIVPAITAALMGAKNS
ncbi:MAG: FAD-binding protein, partial [Gracilibacteraceae bacterium]|nr:FAD-binding protein [Gracilibacteraceae bacterium]